MSSVVGKYWRVALAALLGALIAFGGSFLSAESYSSNTRLLIRGREATFLTSTGADLSNQPGVVDASLSTALAETQGGIVTSREVATMVVDKLDLDKPQKSSGLLASIAHGFGTAYRCTKAFISHGFCKQPEPREGAIQAVQAGLSAGQLGSSAGESSGQPSSFILELTGTGETPEQARDVANAAADAVVKVGAARFATDSKANVDRLKTQVDDAAKAVVDANQAVSSFRLSHQMTDAEVAAVSDISSATSRSTQAGDVATELAGARAQLEALDASIARAQPTQSSSQDIVTGRSSNRITTNSPNPVYNDLLTARETLKARIADLEGRAAKLATSSPTLENPTLTQNQTDLLQLQNAVALAVETQSGIETQYRAALLDASRSSADLTRIGTASLPTYPDEPRRIIYLALGLLFGAIAGGYLTWRRLFADTPVEQAEHAHEEGGVPGIDLTDAQVGSNGHHVPSEVKAF